MKIALNTTSIEDYRRFIRVKTLPKYRIAGEYHRAAITNIENAIRESAITPETSLFA